ncbi:Transcription factor HES-7 [Bagarius yarrelli]|uniref:Transcription factor HES-7 n=1 Tax=Bagarius yarrelli TaxID=175774 RepID=A0A556VX52_BAGYA|nr:Transcription factor HES-7 [Bagarius yarrelli]
MGTPKISNRRVSKRILKPVIEKKRRDRINQRLDELRTLLLDNTLDSRLQNPKLEKAEILELTVEYIRKKATNAQENAAGCNRDPSERITAAQTAGRPRVPVAGLYEVPNVPLQAPSSSLYTAGFQECISRLTSFIECVELSQRENFIQGLRNHLQSHTDAMSQVRGHGTTSTWVTGDVRTNAEPFSFANGLYPNSYVLHHPYPSPPYSLSPPPSPCYSSSSPTYLSVPCHFHFPSSISPLSDSSSSSTSFTSSTPVGSASIAPVTQPPPRPLTPHCISAQQTLRRELFPNHTLALWRPW